MLPRQGVDVMPRANVPALGGVRDVSALTTKVQNGFGLPGVASGQYDVRRYGGITTWSGQLPDRASRPNAASTHHAGTSVLRN